MTDKGKDIEVNDRSVLIKITQGRYDVDMNKYEIESAIIEELDNFIPAMKNVPFDKGLPLMRKEAWRLADKYDTDGTNIFNILLKRFGELKK